MPLRAPPARRPAGHTPPLLKRYTAALVQWAGSTVGRRGDHRSYWDVVKGDDGAANTVLGDWC